MVPDYIFLCHAHEDKGRVREVCNRLKAEGFNPWLDEEQLDVGADFDQAIRKAITQSKFMVIFFSDSSVGKRGYVQREFKMALNILEEIPEEDIFVLPVRLDECQIPQKFKHLLYSDLFEPNGFEKLVRTLKRRLGLMFESEKEDSALNLIFESARSSDIKLLVKPVLASPERVHYGQEMLTVQSANAVNIVCEYMRINMPEVKIIKHVSRHLMQDLNGDIIIIGGPFGNPTASKFLKELRVDIEFFRDTPKNAPQNFMVKVGKDYYKPVQKSNGELIDYGLFIVNENPFDISSNIVLCISTHAYGTYAATYFALTNYAAELTKKFKNRFVAVVECWVDTSESESSEIKIQLPPNSKVNSYSIGELQ